MTSLSCSPGFGQQSEEVFFSTYEPTKEEILEYAVKIGIDPDKEPNIIYLARQGLLHPLPENWKPCYSKQVKAYYYYDRISKRSQWEHPIDILYRAKVLDARKALIVDRSDSTSFADSGFRSFKSTTSNGNPSDGTGHQNPASSSSSVNNAVSAEDSSSSPKEFNKTDDLVQERMKRLGAACTGQRLQSGTDVPSPAATGTDEKADEIAANIEHNSAFPGNDKDTVDAMMGRTAKLSFNEGTGDAKWDTVESKDSEPKFGSSSFNGFTITGTGSQFLKSIKKVEPNTLDLGRKVESDVKGILRDSSLTCVRYKSTPNEDSGTDERKSVRFKIDFGADPTSKVDVESPNRAGSGEDHGGDRPEGEDDGEDDERMKQLSSSETSEQESEASVDVVSATAFESHSFPAGKRSIEQQDEGYRREMKKTIDQEREGYRDKLDKELRALAVLEETKIERELEMERKRYEELLANEKQRLKDQHEQNVAEMKEFYHDKLKAMQADYEEEKAREYTVYQETLQEEFDDRVKKVTESHRTTMATLQKNHDEIVEELERDLKMEEELLKKEHSTNLIEIKIKLGHELEMERQRMRETGEDRLYEKVRCEKRLLEDKYKCLKEKYTRLKTDVRISLERRKKRREQQQQHHSLLSNSYETDNRTSSRPLPAGDKELPGHTSANAMMMAGKAPHNNPLPTPKGPLAKGPGHVLEAKGKLLQYDASGSSEQSTRKTTFVLNSNNFNNNRVFHVDDSSQSETLYSKQYAQGRNIFASLQHEDNFSSDSEFNKISIDKVATENSRNSPLAGTAARPKRKIFTKTKSSSTSKLNSTKHESDAGARPCTPVENFRIQLKKLEELEDQIPDCNMDTPYHLRYPFVNEHAESGAQVHGGPSGNRTVINTDSSELEFFKHRILLERDSVSRAKESLRAQKNAFNAKKRDAAVKHAIKNKQTMEQIFNEQKELTEMEVSLHRTRSLLGEKVIRLRHLESSLQQLVEKEHPIRGDGMDGDLKPKETLSDLSSYSSSGFSSTDIPTTEHHCGYMRPKKLSSNSNESFLYLKRLHSEIQEIWNLLNPSTGMLAEGTKEMDFLNNTPITISDKYFNDLVLPPDPPTMQSLSFTSPVGQMPTVNQVQHYQHYTVTLLEKTRNLKIWLKQAKQEHDMLKKKSFI